jgi:myo-inositol 2-dehydrogenase/D-chiro-inositol 1-dehydrogenase
MKQVAMIGFGRMGKMHFDILSSMPEFQVNYVVDNQAGQNITPIAQLETVLQDDALDGVIIAASSDAHVELIELCSRYHKKLFCEKPISYRVETLSQLQHTLRERGADVQVGLNRRYDPHFSELQNRLAEGEIGKIQVVKITNRDPKRPDLAFAKRSGGLIYDFVIHDLDMVNFLCNEPVTDMTILADALIEPKLKTFHDVDTALISFKLASGALVAIDVSRESGIGYDQRVEVLGEKGMLKVDNQYPTTFSHSNSQGRMGDLPHYSFVERYREAYKRQFQAYARWLNGEITCPPVGLEQILSAVALADRVSEKMASFNT